MEEGEEEGRRNARRMRALRALRAECSAEMGVTESQCGGGHCAPGFIGAFWPGHFDGVAACRD